MYRHIGLSNLALAAGNGLDLRNARTVCKQSRLIFSCVAERNVET